jgi:hypothetical protein
MWYNTNALSADRFAVWPSAPFPVDHGFQPTPLEALDFPPEVMANVSGNECMGLINEWILRCENGHRACRSQPSAPLPHRVIDVGSDLLNEDPRLLECDGERGRYITLSHCWGNTQHFTTETNTLANRCRGMSWGSIPKTFQDAISLTRKLRIRFLWIDSLCIIQDDK